MKIALSHDWLTGMRGGEKCLEAIGALYPNNEIYTLFYLKGSCSPRIESRPIHTSFLQNFPLIKWTYKYYLPLFPKAIESFDAKDFDLVISTSHCVAKSIKKPLSVKHICYCFTPMRYAWLFFDEYFGSYPYFFKKMIQSILKRLRNWDQRTSNRVTHFIAISQHVKNRIQKFYGRDAEVIYPPVDTEFYTPGNEKREDFYLMVSALVPYKRVELAINAFNELGATLVVIGDGPIKKKLEKIAGENIHFKGRLSNEAIRLNYRKCRALIFPGEEDFGIVPVEAQACGAPVIAYEKGGALETVLKNDTGIFFSNNTTRSLMNAVIDCERRSWNAADIRRHAEKFSLERFETEFKSAVEKITEQKLGVLS